MTPQTPLVGTLSVVLHHHLPFVRHPEYPFFLEERWLFEAIHETYLPLIECWRALERDGVAFAMTVTMTPPLANMLADAHLMEKFGRHLTSLRALAAREVDRTRHDAVFQRVARFYQVRFDRLSALFHDTLKGDILGEYRRLQDAGFLEIVTCTATHGFLPLMNGDESAMRAQVEVAARDYERFFGRSPPGIWLAECGYLPGCDRLLAEQGIRYFFVDSHAVLQAEAPAVYGVYAPLACSETGVAAFARDPESSKQVWSSKEGYPGDVNYREYYRDLGFDLPMEQIAPWIHPDGIRLNTGFKYYRITGDVGLGGKSPWDPEAAQRKAQEHAANFMFNRQGQLRHVRGQIDRVPNVVSPYDAELFGHWWFEGPWFLEALARAIHNDQNEIALSTPSRVLEAEPTLQAATPSLSSWGDGGYAAFWCNDKNDWIYPHLHHAAARMHLLAQRHGEATGVEGRALAQAGRELLLAQSSDWAFIMRTGTTVEYAVRRTRDHLQAFARLDQALEGHTPKDAAFVEFLEGRERQWNLFPSLDARVWAR
jgi:1,4-alpha-glucan branching enzyme